MASHPPTLSQQRVLQLLCHAAYVLRATPLGSLSAVYTSTERTTGHHIQTRTPKMVTRLVDAGWIEREPGQARVTYRVTPAGVAAANLTRREKEAGNRAVIAPLGRAEQVV